MHEIRIPRAVERGRATQAGQLTGAVLAALALLSVGMAVGAQETPMPGQDTFGAQDSTTATQITQDAPADLGGEAVATPSSTEQGRTSLDESFKGVTHEEWVRRTRREALRDTKFYAELRSFYLDSDNLNASESEAWALGGSAGFKTGYFRERVAFGATAYTSQRLYGPEDKGGTRLLAPGQRGYSVLGEAYSEILLTESVKASVGLRGFDTPYINRDDTRMTPNTFEAAVVQGSFGGVASAPAWHIGGGYVNKMKERDSGDFVSMATVAGAPAGTSRGTSLAGGYYTIGDLAIGGIDYNSSGIINIAYVEAKDAFELTDRLRLQLAVQHSEQRSGNEDLHLGHEFSGRQFGFKAELACTGALLTAAYTSTGNGAAMQSPWGGYPGYTGVQIRYFDRAGEDAWLLRAAYNFQWVRNLSAYALYVHGSRPEAPQQYAQDEYDLNLQWQATSGRFQGLSLRARYGHVSQAGPDELHTQQLRLILYYSPPGYVSRPADQPR